jgi:uncharacterized protein (DUF1501 family)
MKKMNRREFLKWNVAAALGSTTMLSTLGGLQNVYAAAGDGEYRALVCVYLYGGNDSFSMVVPRSGTAYNNYAAARQGLAVAQGELLPIAATSTGGVDYGFHPAMPEMQQLYNQGKMAVVANVGPLVVPTTAAQYNNRSVPLPPQLFSHSDQQKLWMSGNAASQSSVGWAGKLADLLLTQGVQGLPSLNISIGNTNSWQTGNVVNQFTISPQGINPLEPKAWGFSGQAAYEALAQGSKNSYQSMIAQYATTQERSIATSALVAGALDVTPDYSNQFPANNELAAQLQMVARMISARSQLGSGKQVFFVSMGGWDTHASQGKDHPALLAKLSAALSAFQNTVDGLGVGNQVTTFTATEFGRTLTSNGDGTDHGWGGHHLVMGGAVAGGDIYGTMPQLVRGGPDEVDNSRILPTTSVDEYSATLARWFGVAEGDLDTVFPNLRSFNQRDVGFMT